MPGKTKHVTSERSADADAGTGRVKPASRRSRSAVGEKLREMYDEVVREPIPDDFLELLEEAEKVARAGGAGETGKP